jgi:hypothetical protein
MKKEPCLTSFAVIGRQSSSLNRWARMMALQPTTITELA